MRKLAIVLLLAGCSTAPASPAPTVVPALTVDVVDQETKDAVDESIEVWRLLAAEDAPADVQRERQEMLDALLQFREDGYKIPEGWEP